MAMATLKRAFPPKRLAVLTAGLLSLAAMAAPAAAQGWWPWNNQQQQPPPQQRPAPVPRDPVFRPQGQPGVPAPIPQQQQPGQRANVCVQLESRLVDAQRGAATDQLPRIEAEFKQAERANQLAQSQLERAECYDYWLFSKTLKRTKQCLDLAGQAEASKRKAAELDAQRQQIRGSSTRSLTNDLYVELARNKCGANYEQYVNRNNLNSPFSWGWQDEDAGSGGRGNTFGAPPGVVTYRTVCVRLCDGYFFPISFSTLESHFERDVDACQSRCAAPAELYYYQNPGGSIEQAISVRNRAPYNGLKTALRFRKEYVQGCSCKQAEYTPAPADRPLERKTEAPATPIPARAVAQQPR